MIEPTRTRTTQSPNSANLSSTQSAEKIRKSAQQFEAILLGNIFQKLQDGVSSLSGDNSDSSSRSFSELGIQELATAAAQSGGIGISSMVTRLLERSSYHTDSQSPELKLFRDVPINEMYWQNSEVLRK